MTAKEIISQRLINQQIAETKFTKPEQIVSYLGAMQSQDWGMAKWAIGLRIPGIKNADVEKAYNEGKILRTHMLRPTWHFVSPKNIRWMLQLTSPRVQTLNGSQYRKYELDKLIFKKSNSILVKSLRDNLFLTRNEINLLLKKAKINTDDVRLAYIMMNAELEGIICSGPRKGKQFTYALLDERAPTTKTLHKDEALHELASIYFNTRGPATISDFSWWSGLTAKEAKKGTNTLGPKFLHETFGGKEYFFYDRPLKDVIKLQATFLIPYFDEYVVGYTDKSIYLDPKNEEKLPQVDFFHSISVDGYFGGNWKCTMKNTKPLVGISPLISLTQTQHNAVDKAVKKCTKFYS